VRCQGNVGEITMRREVSEMSLRSVFDKGETGDVREVVGGGAVTEKVRERF
jgi:hypothetical protein